MLTPRRCALIDSSIHCLKPRNAFRHISSRNVMTLKEIKVSFNLETQTVSFMILFY